MTGGTVTSLSGDDVRWVQQLSTEPALCLLTAVIGVLVLHLWFSCRGSRI